MSRGPQALQPGQVLPAPRSGVDLGQTKEGPLTLRLFRAQGTRATVYAAPWLAQLLTLRASLSGASVRIATSRPSSWAGIVRHGGDSQFIVHPSQGRPTVPQPATLVVDDLGDGSGAVSEVAPWQCLLQVGRLDPARPDLTRLSGLAQADVAFFDAVDERLAAEVGRTFGIGQAAASLTVVPRHAVAVVTRRGVDLVRPELTKGERSALGS